MNVIPNITEQQLQERFGSIDKLFTEADVDGDGRVSAEEAKTFFPRFNLPKQVLSNVWSQSSRTPGGLTKEEFKNAMKLIFVFMNNSPSSQFVPIRSSPSPSPLQMMGQSPSPMQMSPGQPVDFSLSPSERTAYEKHFYSLAQGNPVVNESQAMPFFQKAQLDDMTLRHIYRICDFEKNGLLDKDEFVIAFHLIRLKRKNPSLVLPDQCPDVLVPPNKRGVMPGSRTSMNMEDMLAMSGQAPRSMSFNKLAPTSFLPNPSPAPINISGMNPAQVEMNVSRLLNESKDLQDNLFPLQQQNEQNRFRVEELLKQKNELEQQVERDRAELRQAEQEKMRLETQLAELESRVELMRADSKEFQVQLQRIRDEVSRLTELRNKAIQSEQELLSNIEMSRGSLQGELGDFVQLKAELSELKTRCEQLQLEKNSLMQNNSSKSQEATELQNELRQARAQFSKLQSEVNSLQVKNQEFSNATQSSRSELEQLNNQNEQLKQKLASLQKQIPSPTIGANSASIMKLKELAKKAEEFLTELDSTLKKTLVQSNTSAPSPSNVGYRPSPVSATSPTDFGSKPVPAAATTTTTKSFDDDFSDDFGAGFSSAVSVTAKSTKEIPAPAKPVQNAVSNGGFDADFDADFGAANTNANGIDDFGFDTGANTQNTSNDDAWGTFEKSNSLITSSNFGDDAWADDFGVSTTTSTAAATTAAASKKESNEDDGDRKSVV